MLSGTAWWTWHGQQDVVEDIKNLYKWKELDEEKLITKIRTGSKDVCFRSRRLKPFASLAKRRALEGTYKDKSTQRAATGCHWTRGSRNCQSWTSSWWEESRSADKVAFMEGLM